LVGLLLERHAHPAGVQTEGLGQKRHFLAIVAKFHILAFGADDGDVIADAFETAVFRHAAGKGFRLVGDQLKVQLPLCIAFINQGLQLRDFFRFDGFFQVLPHRVAGNDSFL